MDNSAGLQVSSAKRATKRNTSEGMKGIYENWDFPPYQYQEYPKLVKLGNGKKVRVESKREEVERLAESPLPETPENPLVSENDRLRAQLAEQQKQIDQLLALAHGKVAEAESEAKSQAKAQAAVTREHPAIGTPAIQPVAKK